MFESVQRQREQRERQSEVENVWTPLRRQRLTAQQQDSGLMQQQADRDPVAPPTLHYDVDAMLGSVASERPRTGMPQMQFRGVGHRASSAQLQSDPAPQNRTGMPDRLKSGLEQLSGFDLSAVRVHRNSAKPAQLNALAYAQGQDIHLGPGQERQLPHEGWHVVQQLQGRVKPTMQAHGVAINDDRRLEREADRMGAKATSMRNSGT